MLLLALGLIISIPLVVFGASMLMKLMERWPVIITIGAAILGWTALDMAMTDAVVVPMLHGLPPLAHYAIPAAGAVLVVAIGKWFATRAEHQPAA